MTKVRYLKLIFLIGLMKGSESPPIRFVVGYIGPKIICGIYSPDLEIGYFEEGTRDEVFSYFCIQAEFEIRGIVEKMRDDPSYGQIEMESGSRLPLAEPAYRKLENGVPIEDILQEMTSDDPSYKEAIEEGRRRGMRLVSIEDEFMGNPDDLN